MVGPRKSNTNSETTSRRSKHTPRFHTRLGQIVTVICLPSDTTQQLSIIEVTPRPPGLSPGCWKHNVNVYNTGRGSYSGDPHITAAQLKEYEAYIKTNFFASFSLEWAYNQFQNPKCKNMWLTIANWFNAAAGLAPHAND